MQGFVVFLKKFSGTFRFYLYPKKGRTALRKAQCYCVCPAYTKPLILAVVIFCCKHRKISIYNLIFLNLLPKYCLL